MSKKIKKTTSKVVEKQSNGGYVKRFLVRVFHTVVMLLVNYLIVIIGTISVPTILAYILGGLGFGGSEGQSGSVFIVSMMAGFFLTAWIFVGSFVLIRGVVKIYIRCIRRTFSDEMNDKIDGLFKYRKES